MIGTSALFLVRFKLYIFSFEVLEFLELVYASSRSVSTSQFYYVVASSSHKNLCYNRKPYESKLLPQAYVTGNFAKFSLNLRYIHSNYKKKTHLWDFNRINLYICKAIESDFQRETFFFITKAFIESGTKSVIMYFHPSTPILNDFRKSIFKQRINGTLFHIFTKFKRILLIPIINISICLNTRWHRALGYYVVVLYFLSISCIQ